MYELPLKYNMHRGVNRSDPSYTQVHAFHAVRSRCSYLRVIPCRSRLWPRSGVSVSRRDRGASDPPQVGAYESSWRSRKAAGWTNRYVRTFSFDCTSSIDIRSCTESRVVDNISDAGYKRAGPGAWVQIIDRVAVTLTNDSDATAATTTTGTADAAADHGSRGGGARRHSESRHAHVAARGHAVQQTPGWHGIPIPYRRPGNHL